MLALCLMHLETYYVQNHVGIIGLCLVAVHSNKFAMSEWAKLEQKIIILQFITTDFRQKESSGTLRTISCPKHQACTPLSLLAAHIIMRKKIAHTCMKYLIGIWDDSHTHMGKITHMVWNTYPGKYCCEVPWLTLTSFGQTWSYIYLIMYAAGLQLVNN